MENQQSTNMERLNRKCKDPVDELSKQFENFGLSEPGPCEGVSHPTMFLRFYHCSSLEINQKSFQLAKHANKLISGKKKSPLVDYISRCSKMCFTTLK